MRTRRTITRLLAVSLLAAGVALVGATEPASAAPYGVTGISSPNPSLVGQTVHLVVLIYGGSGTGTVEVTEAGSPVATAAYVGPSSTFTYHQYEADVTFAVVGEHAVTATYVPGPGDPPDSGGSSTFTHVVSPPGGPVTYRTVGGPQAFVVPPGVGSLEVTAVGAKGGGDDGGTGATVLAALPVRAGEELRVRVGGGGDDPGFGAFNGGGPGWHRGGGATDVRAGGDALEDRVLVAAAGGGEGYVAFPCFDEPRGGAAEQAAPAACGLGGGHPATAASGGAGGTGPLPGGAGSLGQGGAGSRDGSGGGGGGRYGGGGGGAQPCGDLGCPDGEGAGGGGGSNLVPAGGSASLDATGVPLLTITWEPPPTASATTLEALPVLTAGGPFHAILRTVGGTPIAGQLIRFKIGSVVRCTGKTNAAGLARCGKAADTARAVAAGGYTAEYLGSPLYLPSSDTAGLS